MSMLVEFQDGDGCDGLAIEGSVIVKTKYCVAVDSLDVRLGPWKAPRCYKLRAIRNSRAVSSWRMDRAT
eukprot:2800426-Pleurochrysis_carterae.AAC.1